MKENKENKMTYLTKEEKEIFDKLTTDNKIRFILKKGYGLEKENLISLYYIEKKWIWNMNFWEILNIIIPLLSSIWFILKVFFGIENIILISIIYICSLFYTFLLVAFILELYIKKKNV